jgi:hypothetical protein
MATILLVGSHPEMTAHVATLLRSQGWDVVSAVGAEAGLKTLDGMTEVDALIVGGPAAYSARDRLSARVRARNPYAPVVVPRSIEGLGQQLFDAFGGEAH